MESTLVIIYNRMNKNICFLIIVFLSFTRAEIVPLHRHIAQEIFQEHKPYIIYVHGATHNFQVESVFNSYCFGDKLCAVLDPNIEDYQDILQYVGNKEADFFLMLDSVNKRKYVLSIKNQTITQNQLLAFQYKALNNQLDPYFASQPLPQVADVKCTKLVGSSVGEFLRREERIKIILLYSLGKYCHNCDAVLAQFISFSEENNSQKEVAFGYFNTFLNDHPVIHDEKNPNLLIFIDKNYQRPFELSPDNLQHLSSFIRKTLNKKTERSNKEKDQGQQF